MKIGIDIDDTISNSIEKWIFYADEYERENPSVVKEKNKKFQLLNSHRWLEEFYKWEEKDKEEFFNKYSNMMLQNVEMKENASRIINKLLEEKNEIYIITSRYKICENSDAEYITKKWLEKNNIQYNKIFFNASNTKLQICQEEQIDILIDDSYEVCKKANENNIKVLLMLSSYNNIKDDYIKKVHNWNEVYEEIQKIYKEKVNYNG